MAAKLNHRKGGEACGRHGGYLTVRRGSMVSAFVLVTYGLSMQVLVRSSGRRSYHQCGASLLREYVFGADVQNGMK